MRNATIDSHTTRQAWVEFPIRPRRVACALAYIIGGIILVGVISNWTIYHVAPYPDHPVADFLKRFDLGHEPSIAQFYSATVILCCASLFFFIGTSTKLRRRSWYGLAFFFLLMAIDEAVMFHEMATAAIHLLIPTSGVFYFAWVIPAMVVVIAFGVCSLSFLWSLDRRTARFFVLAGFLFVLGAVGMEMVAGVIFDNAASYDDAQKSVAHVISQAIEEGLEMAGTAILLVALLDHAGRIGQGLQFPIVPSS